ncbi:DEAD/DEAH box helicase family protein [bacterium]|nr:DEAD/DEAH box helicase family protein [bacterium]
MFKYKDKNVEIIGKEEILGKTVCWVKELDVDNFFQVEEDQLRKEKIVSTKESITLISVAARIIQEMQKQTILAPYESSLIPLPHQILVLEKVIKSPFVRFLLADEVGMGKTIEAGLILKELKLRKQIKRILVIVPKSAMLQWQSEMKVHFNEKFHIYDSQMINSLSKTFSQFDVDQEFNFWQQHNNIIVSTDSLKPMDKRAGWNQTRIDQYNKYRMEAVLEANFDLVIIDEVHKMGGSNSQVSRFRLAEALCITIPNALILSATPHRGKPDHFRRVLQLLDPSAFAGEGLPTIEELNPYVIRTEKRQAVDYEGKSLFSERETKKVVIKYDREKHKLQLDLYEAVTEYVKHGFNISVKSRDYSYGLIMILFQRMVSSSTSAVKEAMKGRLQRLSNGENEIFDEVVNDQTDTNFDYQEDYTFDINQYDGKNETEIENEDEITILMRLIKLAEECDKLELDAKAEFLINKYDELKKTYNDPDLKVLIFTEFRATQQMLIKKLSEWGLRCELINGSMDFEKRSDALKRFKDKSQILVATDAAGESLNMQFAFLVVNYDLPWNPMIIEQRIGRVDRIGQKHKVTAFNLLLDNSVDKRVFEVIEEKLDNILEQLGIDKTSDVLDSTMDSRKVNNLYLKSLLDIESFERESDNWLHEIKIKLQDYQSTEKILPGTRNNEISTVKTREIHYSPLPSWLEKLLLNYTLINGGHFQNLIDNTFEMYLDKNKKILGTCKSDVATSLPGIVHFTLQNSMVTKILNNVKSYFDSSNIPVIKLHEEVTIKGYWSLWKIEAKNSFDSKLTIKAIFVSEKGKFFNAFADDIWNQIVNNDDAFDILDNVSTSDYDINFEELKEICFPQLCDTYKSIEMDLKSNVNRIKFNKENQHKFRLMRIERLGIENIKKAKRNRIIREFQEWQKNFEADSVLIPNLECLSVVRIDNG